jgi:TRAF3-interacting protein 1
MDVGAMGKFA